MFEVWTYVVFIMANPWWVETCKDRTPLKFKADRSFLTVTLAPGFSIDTSMDVEVAQLILYWVCSWCQSVKTQPHLSPDFIHPLATGDGGHPRLSKQIKHVFTHQQYFKHHLWRGHLGFWKLGGMGNAGSSSHLCARGRGLLYSSTL